MVQTWVLKPYLLTPKMHQQGAGWKCIDVLRLELGTLIWDVDTYKQQPK